MPEAPHTCSHGDGGDKEQRHEDQQPEVFPSFYTVTHQHLKRQEEEMDPHSNQHGLEFNTGLALSSKNHMHVNGKQAVVCLLLL